jgi:hypothetical protein
MSTDPAGTKCPFCYAWNARRRGPEQACDDCLRSWTPVPTEPDAVFTLAGRSLRVAASQNNPVIPPRHGFAHETFRHPDLARLRRKYRLNLITAGIAGEFDRQLALRDWVCAAWAAGQPSVAFPPLVHEGHVDRMLTRARREGRAYFCTYKAMASVELAAAFGWTARLVNIMKHMVHEIWSNDLNKWALHDSLYNLHYERDGTPLSAREIREEFHRDGARRVRAVWGRRRRDLGPARCADFAWYAVYMHNNFFDFPPGDHIHPLLMPRDRWNRGKHWRQGAQIARRRGDKYLCKGMVVEESDPRHLDYRINQTEILLLHREGTLLARFQHNMPNYGALMTRVNGAAWQRHAQWRRTELRLPVDAGPVTLEARCVNSAGVSGPVSAVTLRSAR